MTAWLVPYLAQAIAMMVDEFYFHHKRGLGRWERWGHPLDTLTVLACYLFVLVMPVTTLNVQLFMGLSVFSCLFITKDEWVHARECVAGEQWLHALLFVLHPIILFVTGWLWFHGEGQAILIGQLCLTGLFAIYQVFYWSFRHE